MFFFFGPPLVPYSSSMLVAVLALLTVGTVADDAALPLYHFVPSPRNWMNGSVDGGE